MDDVMKPGGFDIVVEKRARNYTYSTQVATQEYSIIVRSGKWTLHGVITWDMNRNIGWNYVT